MTFQIFFAVLFKISLFTKSRKIVLAFIFRYMLPIWSTSWTFKRFFKTGVHLNTSRINNPNINFQKGLKIAIDNTIINWLRTSWSCVTIPWMHLDPDLLHILLYRPLVQSSSTVMSHFYFFLFYFKKFPKNN